MMRPQRQYVQENNSYSLCLTKTVTLCPLSSKSLVMRADVFPLPLIIWHNIQRKIIEVYTRTSPEPK